MRLVPPFSRAEHAVEMLDLPAPPGDRAETLADVARLNALFGGRVMTVSHLKRLIAALPLARPVTVLDVGTGGADLPIALVRWARRAGRRIRVLALDRDRTTLDVARRVTRPYPEIQLLQGDALALPLHARSVDVLVSALMLHHLTPDAAVGSLAEMERAARLGFVVNDLVRSRTAYGLVWLATRILTRNRMSRHDGPLSVRRAYTPDELRTLCEKGGLFDVRVRVYRMLARQCAVRTRA